MLFGCYNKSPWEPVGIVCQHIVQGFNFLRASLVAQTKENNAAMRFMLAVYFFAEVFVIGNQNSLFSNSLGHNNIIRNTRRFIIYGKSIVSLRSGA